MNFVKNKQTGLIFKVKKVRNSKKVELENGVVIPNEEFKLNWVVIK
jgi:hypothetical protein